MDDVKRFVGIDVAKAALAVLLGSDGAALSVTNDEVGIRELLGQLKPTDFVILEATGGLETPVASALAAAGIAVAIVNPRQIRDFARATGRLAKTDALDAEVIARFAEAVRPEPRALPDEESRGLGELVARRRQVVEMMTAERNRRRIMADKRVLKRIDRHLVLLQKELTEIERQRHQAARSSPIWRKKEELYASLPGVGKNLAPTLIADLPELGSLGRRAIA